MKAVRVLQRSPALSVFLKSVVVTTVQCCTIGVGKNGTTSRDKSLVAATASTTGLYICGLGSTQ